MLLSREAYPSHPILLVGSIKPVVSRSSPPDPYDVGSTSSEICTAVTGVSGTTNPSAGCRCFPNIRHRLATVGSATPSHSLFGLRHSLPRAAPSKQIHKPAQVRMDWISSLRRLECGFHFVARERVGTDLRRFLTRKP